MIILFMYYISSMKPCKPGQIRNPLTNRCKSDKSLTMKPCKPNQVRNPLTNRCRKIKLPMVPPPVKPVVKKVKPVVVKNEEEEVKPVVKPVVVKKVKPVVVKNEEEEVKPVVKPVVVKNEEEEVKPVVKPVVVKKDEEEVKPMVQKVKPVVKKEVNPSFNINRRPSRSVEQVLNFRESDPNETCVGHSMAILSGQSIRTFNDRFDNDQFQLFLQNRVGLGIKKFQSSSARHLSNGFNILTEFFRQNNDYPLVLSGDAHNTKGHATNFSISSRDGRNCSIWYFDPLGFSGMTDVYKMMMDLFTSRFSNSSWYKSRGRTVTMEQILDVDEEFPFPDGMAPWEITMYKVYSVIEFWKKSSRYIEIKKLLTEWRTGKIGGKNVSIPETCFLSALFIVKHLLNANHVEIISPIVSMKEDGPQKISGDGICIKRNRFAKDILSSIEQNDGGHGACAVWSEIYLIYVQIYASRFPKILDLIIFLRENPYVGETSSAELLGRIMFHKVKDPVLKTFLLRIAASIPKETDIQSDYHTDLNDVFRAMSGEWIFTQSISKRNKNLFLRLLTNYDRSLKLPDDILEKAVKDTEEAVRLDRTDFAETEMTLSNMIMVLVACKHSDTFKKSVLFS